jgi:hypothetical protein
MIPVAILTGILIAVILYAMLTNNNVSADNTMKRNLPESTSFTPPLPSPAPIYSAAPAPGTFTGTAPAPVPVTAPAPVPELSTFQTTII